jgi:pimeloyl-ACP methyl ester carboxylesterase
MEVAYARRGDIEIAYQMFGSPDDEPLVLTMGLGMQMLFWPDEFCEALAQRGFAVVRFDNRDVGLSTKFDHLGAPSLGRMVLRPSTAPYRIEDMADDTASILDAVGWDSAHLVGLSLGGMIAQTISVRHPARVRSLTSIMSTPSPWIGRARIAAFMTLASPPARDAEQAGEIFVKAFRVIGSTKYTQDEEWLRDVGRRSFERNHNPNGGRRQLAAIFASGDRRPHLRKLQIPTLVVHGTADPLIRPAGGRATAEAVPGARLVEYDGMGHDMPRGVWPALIDEISAVAGMRRSAAGEAPEAAQR